MIKLNFWGVRGSTPCADSHFSKYGGHTSCVSVEVDNALIICDAGSGIFELGKWMKSKPFKEATLLLSHVHLDHIIGLPFFGPIWDKNFCLNVYAGHLMSRGGVRTFLEETYHSPLFPVPFARLPSKIDYTDIAMGTSFSLQDGVSISTTGLNHPNGATGYRIKGQGKTICYVTDTEHTPGKVDENVLEFIRGADLVIYDSSFDDEELPQRVGWGHSTWQEGIRLCRAAEVKRLAIFHHEPSHDDDRMEKIEEAAKDMWEGAFVTRQGMEIDV